MNEQGELPRRRSIRLKGHNYSWTASYFITLRSEHHEPVFEMPELQSIIIEAWLALPVRFPHVQLDEYVIMPDHMHGILHFCVSDVQMPALGRVIGAYKSLTAIAWLRYIETHNVSWSGNLWQRNYHEHIIRDASDLAQKREYIRKNPLRWQQNPNPYS